MADIYEKTADIFLSSMAGQMSGMTRDQLIAHFKKRFPCENEFKAVVEAAKLQAEAAVLEAQANLAPGHVLAFGYVIDELKKSQH
jgi:hypothetical protein